MTLEVSGSSETRITEQLRADLFVRLVSERIFTVVHQRENPADYNLKIMVLSSNIVTPGSRLIFACWAGTNKLKVDVKLFETATGKQHSHFVVTGESACVPTSVEDGIERHSRGCFKYNQWSQILDTP